MPDPIQVEQSFRELMEYFESTLSIRHRYSLFRKFVESLEGSYKKFESYILQVIDELPEYAGPLTWTGIDPEQIELDLAILQSLDTELQLSEKIEKFEDLSNRLTEVCILLYACLNDLNGIKVHLKSIGLSKFSYTDHPPDSRGFNLLKSGIKRKLRNSKDLSTRKKQQLQRLLREIKGIQSAEDWKALIPVAEKYQQEQYGRLREISVERYSETEKEDELIWNMHVYGASNPSLKEKKDVLIAARNLFKRIAGNRTKKYYRGGVNFKFQHAFHIGNSANLAISALWFTHLLEASNQQEVYEVQSHSVITGNVDDEGNVLPVDEETISLKAKAAFFSWGKILAVPAMQRDLFEKELKDLREKYPTRQIGLYGVNNMRELFFDRRLSSHSVEGRLKYYFKKIKSQEFRAISIPFIILLLGIIGRMIFGPVDQNPVFAEFDGEHMILNNQFGQTIQAFQVGALTIQDLQHREIGRRINKVSFYDLNEDGINEVFYAKDLNNQNTSRVEKLIAYSVSGDSLIWEKALNFELQFPNKPSIGEDGYRIFNINFLQDASNNQTSLIVSLAHNKFFPGLILKVNPETGEELARYIHTGIVYQTLTHDVNGDNIDEIIGLGVNNAFDQATVAFILNSNEMNGHSPLTDEYKLNGYEKAKEMDYVRFPRSVVGNTFRRRFMNNKPYYLQIEEDEQTILVRVYEFTIQKPSPFEKDDASLFFYFNYDFEIQSIGTDSNYDLWARNLYEDGMIPFEPDHEYFEAFKDSLFYWDGDDFRVGQK